MTAYDELFAYAGRRGHRVALDLHAPNQPAGPGYLHVLADSDGVILASVPVWDLGRDTLDAAARSILAELRADRGEA